MQPQKNTVAEDDVLQKRKALREKFLQESGLGTLAIEELKADASFRRYYRLHGGDKPMLLMQDPPDRPPVPPFVMVEPFVKIADHLRELGLKAPEVYHQDIKNGLLVIEDFGDDTYTRLFEKGRDPKPLYEMAVDALITLHRHPKRCDIDLPPYNDQQLVDEAMLLLDWYYPALTGKTPTPAMKDSFAQVWRDLFADMPKNQQTLVLRDYHVDNLMLTAKGKCGQLDFQDALIGQASYDLMSLLEDARRDVKKDLKKHLYDRYLSAQNDDFDREGFDYAFRVLAAQRHAKVLGIFVRLSVRDGKDRYLTFIPHVHRLFLESVTDSRLAPLQQWFKDNGIDIPQPLNTEQTKKRGPKP